MKKLLILLMLLGTVWVGPIVQAQVVGKQYTVLEAETVEDKVVTLPQDQHGRITLLGMAYSKKSENNLNKDAPDFEQKDLPYMFVWTRTERSFMLPRGLFPMPKWKR